MLPTDDDSDGLAAHTSDDEQDSDYEEESQDENRMKKRTVVNATDKEP